MTIWLLQINEQSHTIWFAINSVDVPLKLMLVNLQASICQVENCVADVSKF